MNKQCKACKSEIDPSATKCAKCGADQRNWFRKHPILTVILALFIIGMVGSAGSSKNDNGNNSKQGTVSPTSAPVAEKISARQLVDDFDANQVAAEASWENKFVEFSAKITNITDSGILFSNVASKDFSFAQISCRVKDKQQLLPLKNEQTITVRGIVGKQTIGVIEVSNCEVVK